jgi:hypothetical protein
MPLIVNACRARMPYGRESKETLSTAGSEPTVTITITGVCVLLPYTKKLKFKYTIDVLTVALLPEINSYQSCAKWEEKFSQIATPLLLI